MRTSGGYAAIRTTRTWSTRSRRRRSPEEVRRSPLEVSVVRAEEPRKEVLHGVTEGDGAVPDTPARGARLGLGGLAGFLELLAGVLRAFLDGLADALGGLFDAFSHLAVAKLLRA